MFMKDWRWSFCQRCNLASELQNLLDWSCCRERRARTGWKYCWNCWCYYEPKWSCVFELTGYWCLCRCRWCGKAVAAHFHLLRHSHLLTSPFGGPLLLRLNFALGLLFWAVVVKGFPWIFQCHSFNYGLHHVIELVHSHRLSLVPNLRGWIWHKTDRADRLYVFREDDTTETLCNGTSITSSNKHFWKEASGFEDSHDWRVLVGFSTNSTYSVLFSSSPKKKSSTVMLRCSWRPRRPKYRVRSHQTIWTRTCVLPFPSFLLFPHSSFSSVVVRLRALFGRFPLPCCRSSLAFSSRTCFELLNYLSRMMEYLYSFSMRYRSIAVTIARRLPGS